MTMDNHEYLDLLLLRPGLGVRLLEQWHDIPTLAQNLDAADLTDKQRARLRAAFTLRFLCEPRRKISSPADAYNYVQDLQTEPQEHLVVLTLNTRNDIIHRADVYKGSLNTSLIRVAEVFRPAIIHNAAAIIVVHNHPSGDPSPSPEDVSVTRAIVEMGKALDIDVLDHLIVGYSRFVSLKQRGLGFS